MVHPNVTTSVLTLVSTEAVKRIAQGGDVKAITDQDEFLPLMEMMAKPVPRIGANELFPMRTRRPVMGLYEMNANFCGIMWSVAPVSATRRLEAGQDLRNANAVDCAEGLARRARTSF